MRTQKVYRWILLAVLFGALGYAGIRLLKVNRNEKIEKALVEQAQVEKERFDEKVRLPVPPVEPKFESGPIVPEVIVGEGVDEVEDEGKGEEGDVVLIPPPPPARVASDDPERAEKAADVVLPELAPQLKRQGLSVGNPVFLRIFKAERSLELWVFHQGDRRFRLFKTYPIAAMSGRLGPKLAEGDLQAPEGFYHVGRGRMNPQSNYHLAFDVGYPNAFDRAQSRTGSFIMIHGKEVSVGCFAMTDYGIEEIYSLADAALKGGQESFRIHVFPFRMTEEAMVEARGHGWFSFWENLRDGFLRFERTGIPPEVSVENKRYVFSDAS